MNVPIVHNGNMQLSAYLKQNDLTPEKFGAVIGVHRTTVIRYLQGTRLPRWATMGVIMEKTGGAVRPEDFMSPQGAAE